MITIDQVRDAQRNAPNAPETKQLQRHYEAELRAERRERQGARNREQHAEDTRIAREHETCDARDTEEVAAIFPDFATAGGWSHAIKYTHINVRGRIALVTGGALQGWTNADKTYRADVLSARRGAHWSHQPMGLSGYWVIYTIRVPAALRTTSRIDMV